jgi:hypothetical protein
LLPVALVTPSPYPVNRAGSAGPTHAAKSRSDHQHVVEHAVGAEVEILDAIVQAAADVFLGIGIGHIREVVGEILSERILFCSTRTRGSRVSDQYQAFEARMPILADDDVIVHRNAEGLGDL